MSHEPRTFFDQNNILWFRQAPETYALDYTSRIVVNTLLKKFDRLPDGVAKVNMRHEQVFMRNTEGNTRIRHATGAEARGPFLSIFAFWIIYGFHSTRVGMIPPAPQLAQETIPVSTPPPPPENILEHGSFPLCPNH